MVLPKVKLWYDKIPFNCIVLTLLKQDAEKYIFIKNNMHIASWKEWEEICGWKSVSQKQGNVGIMT